MTSFPAGAGNAVAPVDGARISVVIPAYNAAAYLPAALKSVFEQSLRPAEIIVVDDGSTDDTAAVASALGVRVLTGANRGCAAARNIGTSAATGDYIAYLDADDIWHPDKLAVQLAALASHAGPAFSFTDFRCFDDSGVHQKSTGLRRHPAFRRVARTIATRREDGNLRIAVDGKRAVLSDCYIQPSSVLVRRADVLAVGGFDETFRAAEDYEFFLRLFGITPAVAVMQSLLLYRRHAVQITADQTVFGPALFELARHVARSPDRYPEADVRHMAAAEFLRHLRMGVEHARRANFNESVKCFAASLAARWTLRAALGLGAARLCRSPAGRGLFHIARLMWKRRPRRAASGPT